MKQILPLAERGVGHTARQILEAPRGATFVWVTGVLGYPSALASYLGRHDLNIRSPRWAKDRLFRGTRRPVVLDHAITVRALGESTYRAVQAHNQHADR